MIDSHLHLDDGKLAQYADEIIKDFPVCRIEYVINNSCNKQSMRDGINLAEKYDAVYCTVGMHPHDAKYFDDEFAAEMEQFVRLPKTVAVGEIGLDYYYDLSDRNVQRDVFARQIEIADKSKLPVTLHVRDAYGDAADILEAQKKFLNNGVLWHCYSGSAEFARQMAKKGHYFAFGGAITFKNAKKEDVIAAVPFDRVLSETDSPYMTPAPFRGKVNRPEYVRYVVEKLARAYGKTFEETEKQISENSGRLFPKIKAVLIP